MRGRKRARKKARQKRLRRPDVLEAVRAWKRGKAEAQALIEKGILDRLRREMWENPPTAQGLGRWLP